MTRAHTISGTADRRSNALLFTIAFARARPCYCYGCICLDRDERAYQRRVFRLARFWHRQLEHERNPVEPAPG